MANSTIAEYLREKISSFLPLFDSRIRFKFGLTAPPICLSLFVIYLVVGKHGVNSLMYSLYKRMLLKTHVPRIVNNESECHAAVLELRRKCEKTRVIGLDCEWVSEGTPNRKSKVALLQLASVDGFSSLFRLCKIGQIPPSLSELLSDRSVLKTGVAVCDDANRLYKDYGVHCNGCLDLRHMARQLEMQPLGLAKLSKLYLGQELNKDWRLRCSNWEAETLTNIQIKYASDDAVVSIFLFQHFNKMNLAQSLTWWQRFLWHERKKWFYSQKFWSRFIDTGFKYKFTSDMARDSQQNNYTTSGNNMTSRQLYTRPCSKTALQRPLYHNIFLQAPDGVVLCTCDEKKMAWYLKKDLAVVICENPKTLRLKFEPTGKLCAGDGYYALPKENICAVCGSTNSLRRKNIVPHEYRKFFPVEMKEHSSHDVLLLCVDCHCRSQYLDYALKQRLADKCDAPIRNILNSSIIELPETRAAKSAARALLVNSHVIPEKRKVELRDIVVKYLENINSETDLTEEVLCFLSKTGTYVPNVDYQPHGRKVVDCYKNKTEDDIKGLHELEQLWRNHFISNLKPKYLPERWSVSYIHTDHISFKSQ